MSRPNATQKSNRLGWTIFLMVAIGSVIYVYTGGDDTAAPTKKPFAKSTKSTGTTDFIPLDSSLQVADLKTVPKDAFLPLVSKTNGGGGELGPIGIPLSLTGGEEWSYTGMVEVNGASQAVFENSKTSDTTFLTMGQHWKKAKVKRISDSDVELEDDNGKVFTVKMSEAPSKSDALPVSNPNAPAVVQPPTGLAGPIGPQLDVTPLPGVLDTSQTGAGAGGGGGRRRGRRGGGGGAYAGG